MMSQQVFVCWVIFFFLKHKKKNKKNSNNRRSHQNNLGLRPYETDTIITEGFVPPDSPSSLFCGGSMAMCAQSIIIPFLWGCLYAFAV